MDRNLDQIIWFISTCTDRYLVLLKWSHERSCATLTNLLAGVLSDPQIYPQQYLLRPRASEKVSFPLSSLFLLVGSPTHSLAAIDPVIEARMHRRLEFDHPPVGGKHLIEIPRKPEPMNWPLISGKGKPSLFFKLAFSHDQTYNSTLAKLVGT